MALRLQSAATQIEELRAEVDFLKSAAALDQNEGKCNQALNQYGEVRQELIDFKEAFGELKNELIEHVPNADRLNKFGKFLKWATNSDKKIDL